MNIFLMKSLYSKAVRIHYHGSAVIFNYIGKRSLEGHTFSRNCFNELIVLMSLFYILC
jgi:hypothetical protein